MITLAVATSLLQAGESQAIEYKTSFDCETIESLVAFVNSQGETVLIGVADSGSANGITLGKETLIILLGQITYLISPSIIPDIEEIPVMGNTIVDIRINEYPVKPVSTRGKFFRRIAASNHPLNHSEITDLYMQDAYEALGKTLDALSVAKIEIFSGQVNECSRFTLDKSPLLTLEKLKFISDNRPTWSALLLFAKEPPRHHIHIGGRNYVES